MCACVRTCVCMCVFNLQSSLCLLVHSSHLHTHDGSSHSHRAQSIGRHTARHTLSLLLRSGRCRKEKEKERIHVSYDTSSPGTLHPKNKMTLYTKCISLGNSKSVNNIYSGLRARVKYTYCKCITVKYEKWASTLNEEWHKKANLFLKGRSCSAVSVIKFVTFCSGDISVM